MSTVSHAMTSRRRDWLRLSAAGVSATRCPAGWRPWPTTRPAIRSGARSCILLWMNGGPSQMDTFDLKPGHANGGPFKEIDTCGARHQDQRAPAARSPSTWTRWPSSAR